MVTLTKSGDSVVFTFQNSNHYLYGSGNIEVPMNSLILIIDESDIVTFKKCDGDIFVSFNVNDSNFSSKDEVEEFYKENMVGGGGIDSGTVESMISEATSGKADTSAVTESINAAVSGKADSSAVTASLADKLDISVWNAKELAIASALTELNEDKQPLLVAGSGITIDSNNVISTNGIDSGAVQTQIDQSISGKADTSAVTASLSAKLDTSAFNTYSANTNTALNAKQDKAVELRQAEYDALAVKDPDVFYIITDAPEVTITVDPSLNSGSTNAVANSAITSAIASIDERVSEDEEVTAAALNSLNNRLGGLTLLKLTEAEYEALTVKDENTLYVIINNS